ncbi:hypothetical protein RND81_06G238500 [Saponaria officinalis]|uniref:UBX domain-containing protein n=1 Tax=Saponaria officinalis TaxID=3572 RepID=A0AAW1KA57_SAPOF
MASINRELIETFMSITGSPETVALQTLEEHAGNLNEAVDAYFSEGDRNVMQDAPVTDTAPSNDLMDIDYPPHLEPRGPSSLLSATRGMNPFSLLDPTFRRALFDRPNVFDHSSEFMGSGRAPFVSHPREVREIPIDFRGGDDNSVSQPSHGPRVEDVTDIVNTEGPEIRGTVVIDEEDDDDIPGNLRSNQDLARPIVLDDSDDFGDDIEEEMIRAAIEASKRDAELQNDEGASQHDDTDTAHAVSLPARTAEQQRVQREHGLRTGASGASSGRLVDEDEVVIIGETDRRHKREAGSSSIRDVVDVEEQPLVRHRSRDVSSGSVEVSPVASPPRPAADSQPQLNGSAFTSSEWGGISSEEHDEAVMLEAAMFGGVPERGYRIPYAPHQMMRPRVGPAWTAPRPPSPSLVAQRAIREQQDDEYLASLQADREKELKAMAEENAAREAALEEQKRKEEAAQRKLQEEQELERQLAAKQASLPEEPALDDENAITLLVRMPDGSRHGRRFRKSDKLQSLFDFIDVGRVLKPGTYRLVRPYPRKAFSDGESSMSLSELGLTSKQEALFLELI